MWTWNKMQQMWIFWRVHYLGYLVGTNSVQPLPEKVATIQALEAPRNIEELWHFLGLVRFYRKFIPFFANVTAALNTMLWKGAVFKCTKQCNNPFNLLKSDMVKMPRLQYPNPNKLFKLFMDMSKHSYLGILHSRGGIRLTECRASSCLYSIFFQFTQ